MVFWLHENQVIKRGKNDIIKIEKRGRILRIILKKRGKRDIVKKPRYVKVVWGIGYKMEKYGKSN